MRGRLDRTAAPSPAGDPGPPRPPGQRRPLGPRPPASAANVRTGSAPTARAPGAAASSHRRPPPRPAAALHEPSEGGRRRNEVRGTESGVPGARPPRRRRSASRRGLRGARGGPPRPRPRPARVSGTNAAPPAARTPVSRPRPAAPRRGGKLVRGAVGETWGGARGTVRRQLRAPNKPLTCGSWVFASVGWTRARTPGGSRATCGAAPRPVRGLLRLGPSAPSTRRGARASLGSRGAVTHAQARPRRGRARPARSPPCSAGPGGHRGNGAQKYGPVGADRGSASAVVRVGTDRGAPRATLKTAPRPRQRGRPVSVRARHRPAARPRPSRAPTVTEQAGILRNPCSRVGLGLAAQRWTRAPRTGQSGAGLLTAQELWTRTAFPASRRR